MRHSPLTSLATYEAARDYIRSQTDKQPKVGLVLGSGLGPLANEIDDAIRIPYSRIPNFPVSTAPSHAGTLVIGELCGQVVVAMQGRVHTYEGYTPAEVVLPIRVMKLMGVETVLLTNAAGGLNTDYNAGDLMLAEDHINLFGSAGGDPTRGPNIDALGPRFTSLTEAYDTQLKTIVQREAQKLDISLRRGILAFSGGPSFETPAEARMLRLLGADAVCMSTVPEVLAANHCGLKVMAISAITNLVIDTLTSKVQTIEEEVFEQAEKIIPYFSNLVRNVIASL